MAKTGNNYWKLFGKIFGLILVSLLLFLIASILINFQSWQALAQSANSGQKNLKQALNYLNVNDLSSAGYFSQLAEEDFSQALENIENIKRKNPLFKIKRANQQLLDLERVAITGKMVSLSLNRGLDLADEVKEAIAGFDSGEQALSPEQKIKIIELLFEFEPEIMGLKANLDLALYNLENSGRQGILWPIRGQLNEAQEKLSAVQELSGKIIPLLRLAPILGGWPTESRWLLLFQNNDELRPTGGFLGSYATLGISELGKTIEMQTGDVYHLDMPSIEHLETIPPEPIRKYMQVQKWYLRDANWSPDWPTAARFIEWLFYQESAQAGLEFTDLTGIIAITPDLVADLIDLTGSINLDGEVYTSENLQKLLQYQTGIGYREEDIPSWERKNIINDLALILKDRLQSLPANQAPSLLSVLNKAIVRRDILIYFTQDSAQALAHDLGVDGAIKQVKDDYLMVVDANLAAFKSDAVMDKNWHYHLQSSPEGWRVNLELDYQHQGGFDWRTTRYRSYTRVLAPLGSQFLELSGLPEGQADFSVSDDQDLNKTVFGFFFSVEPGSSKTITLSYLLPPDLNFENQYQLYIQRQPGSRIQSFNFSFSGSEEIVDYYPDNFTDDDNQSFLTTDLESDKVIRLFFK